MRPKQRVFFILLTIASTVLHVATFNLFIIDEPVFAQATSSAATKEVQIKIYDVEKKVFVEAKRKVPVGSNAFEVLTSVVHVEFDPTGTGAFVRGLAGLTPPEEHFWALYIDGKLSCNGISNIKIMKDLLVEWRIEKLEGGRRPCPAVFLE